MLVSTFVLELREGIFFLWCKGKCTSQSSRERRKVSEWIVLLHRIRASSSSAGVEEDVLQPVKGIELREEDGGETVPNMGIECASGAPPTWKTHTHTLSQKQEGIHQLLKPSRNKMKDVGQTSI